MTPIVIGLVGQKGVGKTTVATLCTDWEDHAIADSLKDGLAAMCSLDRQTLDDPDEKDHTLVTIGTCHYTIRQCLQLYGDGMRHAFGPSIFIDTLMPRLQRSTRVIISDVRYPHEADWVQNTLHGHLIRIVPGTTCAFQAGDLHTSDDHVVDSHLSERLQATIQCDYTLTNNKQDLQSLGVSVAQMVRVITNQILLDRDICIV